MACDTVKLLRSISETTLGAGAHSIPDWHAVDGTCGPMQQRGITFH